MSVAAETACADPPYADLVERITARDWNRHHRELDARGHSLLPGLLDVAACRDLIDGYADAARFRSRVVMARHGFGQGEYQYFAYPLPAIVSSLRSAFYDRLVDLANQWNGMLGSPVRYPASHAAFLARCHAGGQSRATPLLLRYGPGDYNCLHQDLYGEHVFPLQVAVLLSRPGCDFDGGEFVLTEQRPRRQSRVDVVPLRQGDAVVFAVNQRPVAGTLGSYRATLRHGVSRVRSGNRYTLGVILHDAQ
ncbi:MAG: prolyl 4-hydroxylase [Rhodanobacteraceae bacterium]